MTDDHLKRRLSALVSADVVGYSRLMADDEVATVRTLTACRERVAVVVGESNGRLVDFVGDNMLAEFPSTLDAVDCAVKIHRALAEFNTSLSEHRHLNFRIGIHLGDVMFDGERIYGDGVNIAARLEALAEPCGICVSDMVYKQIRGKFSFDSIDLGEQQLKNIPDPMRVFRIVASDAAPQSTTVAPESIKRPSLPLPTKPSLAVLPFVNLSTDPEQDHFSDGLTLDIMTALVQIPGLFLISEASMFSYKSAPVSIRELGRQLGVSHVLDGGVRRAGNRVRITARLVETAGGRQVWAQRFDRELGDIFAVQDEITEEIVTAMDVELVYGVGQRTVRQALKNPSAIECYYRGWSALFGSSREDISLAQQMFEDIIRLETESSIGYALAAWTYWWAISCHVSDDVPQALNRATERAQQALQLQDVTGLPNLVMAQVHLFNKEHDKALAASERAVLARPSCDASFAAKASVLTYLGRPAEAIELAQCAIRLSPVYPSFYPAVLATAYYGCGRFEEAIDAAEISLKADADNLDALLMLAAANAALGRAAPARKFARDVLRLNADFRLETFAASQPYKNPQQLEQILARLKQAGL
jgi:adenylate cyclase